MTISSIFNSALSALNANQKALQITSTNIANVNTPEYARQRVQQETLSIAGFAAGVKISDVQRITDRFLQTASYSATAEASKFGAQAQFHDRLQALLGRPDDNSSIPGRLDAMFAGVADLVIDPASSGRRQNFLSLIDDFSNEVSRLSSELQNLRSEASVQISQDIAQINAAIERIHALNPQIIREEILGGNVSGLEEQRDQALKEISSMIDIRVSYNPDGSVHISTQSGRSLLDSSAYQLQYAPPSAVTADTQFPQITVHQINQTTGTINPAGKALDPQLGSGTLRGLLDMRDTVLVDMAYELGQLSQNAIDQVNAVHNANTAVPAPNSLTGRNSGLLLTDLQGFTGQSTFAVVDAAGVEVNSVTVDFTALGGAATINDVVNAVNAGLGADGTMTFVNGVMTLTATNPANGVLIAQDATLPSDRAGRGFSHFFGMNDLMQARVPSFFETGFATTDAHGFTAGQTVDLEFVGPNGEVVSNYTLTIAGPTFNDILVDLNGAGALGNFLTFSMDADGALITTPQPGFEDYTLQVNGDTTDRGGTAVSFTGLFGVGPRYDMDTAREVSVVSRVAANRNLLSLAQYDTSAAAGTPVITIGDSRGALAFQTLESQVVSFDAAGRLGALGLSLSQYSATVLSNTGLVAAQAQDGALDNFALAREIENRLTEVSGVNLDEELANMVIFQNAYNAAARLISAAQEMMDALLASVR